MAVDRQDIFKEDKKPWLDFSNLNGDAYGGIVAAIVALPLGLAFGAGVFPHDEQLGATAGLWGAILVGFFAAAFGGTNTQISGPTGPMVVVFATLLASLTAALQLTNPGATNVELIIMALPLLFAAVVLGGVFQILMGVFKLGKFIKLVPYTVISGFMSGIGVIIILLQTSRLFGGRPESGQIIDAVKAIPVSIANLNPYALGISALTLFIVFFWPKKIGKFLPGTLAALIIGTVVSLLIPGAPLLGEIKAGIPEFVMPQFSFNTITLVIGAAFTLAILGAIDSLLTSMIADTATRTRHDSDQELIGQGIGNTIAGFFGALPGAGATMRTMVNIRTGGTTKLSGMVHGLMLAIIVLIAAPLAAKIPTAVLAGILVKVGFDIIDFDYLKKGMKGPRWDLAVMVMTLFLTVFTDLITAVGAGVFVAAALYIWQLAKQQTQAVASAAPSDTNDAEQAVIDAAKGKIMLYDMDTALSFVTAADLGHYMRKRVKQGVEAIVLDFSRTSFVDVSAIRAVETIASDMATDGKPVYTVGMSDVVISKIAGLGADKDLSNDRAFNTRIEALNAASAAL
jgi:SulP family sulfate permease